MSISDRVTRYLQENRVRYETQGHRTAFTAQEVAASEHISGDLVAKVVIAFADERMVMLVLPASHRVDFARAASTVGASEVRLAEEREFSGHFPDCEVGAMPPFGNLYDVPVFVDPALAGQERIVFNAGTHAATMSMRYRDFERLVQPATGEIFARH